MEWGVCIRAGNFFVDKKEEWGSGGRVTCIRLVRVDKIEHLTKCKVHVRPFNQSPTWQRSEHSSNFSLTRRFSFEVLQARELSFRPRSFWWFVGLSPETVAMLYESVIIYSYRNPHLWRLPSKRSILEGINFWGINFRRFRREKNF